MGLFGGLFRKKHQTEIGKEGEDYAKADLAMNHHEVKRAPVGSDFETRDRDLLTGKEKRQKWEVKVNNSPLSERQKQTKGLKVIRLRETQFGYEKTIENRRGEKLEYNYMTGRHARVPKARKEDPLGVNMFSDKPQRRAKTNDDLFGFGSMSGGGSTSTRKSRKNEDVFGMGDMFGNGSSSDRKRKRKDDFWGF